METVHKHIAAFDTTFHVRYNCDSPIQEMWTTFTEEIQKGMTNLVPSKWSTLRYNQPWVNTSIKRLARRKKKAFKKIL